MEDKPRGGGVQGLALILAVAGIVSSVVVVPVWAYSTFVTIRERDVLRGINQDRLGKIEQKIDSLGTSQVLMDGKLDVILQFEKHRR